MHFTLVRVFFFFTQGKDYDLRQECWRYAGALTALNVDLFYITVFQFRDTILRPTIKNRSGKFWDVSKGQRAASREDPGWFQFRRSTCPLALSIMKATCNSRSRSDINSRAKARGHTLAPHTLHVKTCPTATFKRSPSVDLARQNINGFKNGIRLENISKSPTWCYSSLQ